MQVATSLLDNKYAINIYTTIFDIDKAIWNNINIAIPFYKTYQFLSIIEEIQQDIKFRYITIKKEDKIIAVLYMQLLDFSFNNLVRYSSNNSKGLKNRFKKYIAQKETKLLNLGNVFFTGDNGIIANDEQEIINIIPAIFKNTNKSFTENKPSASLVANIYLQDENKCAVYGHNQFHAFITEPDMFMTLDVKWNNFKDYMQSLSSKYRVRTKKILTTSSTIHQKELFLEDIKQQKTSLAKLYNNVVNHVAFNMANLNIVFFEKMKMLYGDRCIILGYYLKDELVGFACLFNVDISILHVHYIGLNYDVNKEYKLYNRMLLDFVNFAINKKKQHIHFGRTATEIKTTVGAIPILLQAYLKMNNSIVNLTLPYFLNSIKPAEFIARNPFKE